MKKFEEYYIGLDMGTGSVGWAVTDPTYNIIKRHGKALWGIRLFESAKTAEERRIFRTSRRRTERRKNRLHLLQEIFAEEISKKDMGFYQRMKESKYWHEDKKDINGNMPELPYALFADDGFTDKDYYKKYPTIFHLRYALATNTTDAAWFVRNNPGRTYNLKKMFENETVKRGNETAWIPGDNGTICTVKKWMRKNNVLFTRRAYEVKGGLFDQNILKKGKGQIPIKGGADERLRSRDKYGAYNKASGAYFMLVESDGKKGERKRTIEFVPVYLAKSLEESVELRRRYCEEELGLVNPDVRILKIKINTLFDVDGFKMHLSGRTGKQLLFKGANQLVLSEELQLIVKKIGKYCADYKENKEAVLSEKSEVTQEVLEELYDEFLHKLRNSLYGHRLSAQIEKIEKGKEIFQSMSNEQKCLILMEILHLFQCASQAANLQLIDGPGKAGILVLNNDISKLEDMM